METGSELVVFGGLFGITLGPPAKEATSKEVDGARLLWRRGGVMHFQRSHPMCTGKETSMTHSARGHKERSSGNST